MSSLDKAVVDLTITPERLKRPQFGYPEGPQ
jgi:hypothetical protein